MKKKLALFAVLCLILAMALCACEKTEKPPENPPNDGWQVIQSPSMSDIYTKFLGGFTSIASEFSRTKLNSSPKVSLDGKLKVGVNENDFYAVMKMNYDNNKKQDMMLSFQLTTTEDSYDDMVLGLFVYREKIYIAFGETKFSLNLKADSWSSFFPFDYNTSTSVSNAAMLLSSTLVNAEDPEGKHRLNGANEEYKYTVNLDLPKSLQRLLAYVKNNADSVDIGDLSGYGDILSSIFGVTLEDIADGNFPVSSLKLNFTTSNMKISGLDISLDIDDVGDGTLFEEKDMKLDLHLDTLKISKQNVSIPFVNTDYNEERAKYVYYVDNAFRIKLDSEKQVGSVKKNYEVDITAKIFQDDVMDNYAFIEYRDKSAQKIERAVYAYRNVAYFYERSGEDLVCTLSMPFDLSEIASKTVANDFGTDESFNWLTAIGYFIGAFRIGEEKIDFKYGPGFYEQVWFNFDDMLAFVDDKFEESLLEMPEIEDFIDFATRQSSVIGFRYDTAFLLLVPDSDERLAEVIERLETAQPQRTLTESAGDPEVTEGADG